MKQYVNALKGRQFLTSLLVTLLLIWLLGPYVAFAGKIPLETTFNRLIASVICFAIYFYLEFKKSLPLALNPLDLSEEIKLELQQFQLAIKTIAKTLYLNGLFSFFLRYKKPWYLVIGPELSGKTTLLQKTDLNLKNPSFSTTKTLQWWLAEDALFIDIAGKYLRDAKANFDIQLYFQGLINLLKRYRRQKPINGVILTLNLQEITVNTKEQTQLQKIKIIIHELVEKLVDFPLYIIITRSDTIEGFTEFFEDLGPEERNQVFGISFPLHGKDTSLPQLFNDKYNELLVRLNERILWRLQKERHLEKIGRIKNFPLQMEYLKTPLAKILNLILPTTALNLRGIFFTSSYQKEGTFDNLTKTLSTAYDVHPLHQGYRGHSSKNYFIADVFKRILSTESQFYSTLNPEQRLNSIISFFIIVFTSLCLLFFYKSFNINALLLKQINKISFSENVKSQPSADNFIQQLNTLDTLIQQLKNHQGPWYSKIGVQQSEKIATKSQALYQTLLTKQFISYLQRTLEIQLQNTQEDNINQLYATLKAYLMLGDHKHMEKKFLISWFTHYWQQLDNKAMPPEKMAHHLTILLQQKVNPLKLDTTLIESKRLALNIIPQSRLVLIMLQNKYQKAPVILTTNTQTANLLSIPAEIPGIYNILNFKDVYYREISQACKDMVNGDWVLDQKPIGTYSNIKLNQLATEVKAIYLNEYVVTWNALLTKIKLEEFTSLEQIAQVLTQLNDTQSPLIQLINTIKNNTQPLSDSVEFTQQISSQFLALNALSNDLLKNANQASLTAVKLYIDNLIKAKELDFACYEAAKTRMLNQNIDALTTLLQHARLMPEPLQTWHTTLVAESWRLILKNAQNHLNKIWVETVYPQYLAVLDKRYPLFNDSTVDIALTDFALFFGYGGAMDSFFKNYLEPFIDNSRLYWEWKSVDSQKLNIPQLTLEMFIRAALIQKMFFSEASRIPAINFSLIPAELDPSIQSFNLALDGQQLMYQKDNEQIISLAWPGPQPNHCELTFFDMTGKKTVITEEGPWAWFKLLDKSQLEPTNNPKHFRLNFLLNGAAAHYELYTTGVVNPFIPGILNQFRCPPNLLNTANS